MKTLRKGDTGNEVREMQTALNRFGASLNVDGAFGPSTEKALKKFQEENALDPDCVCGPLTWAKLKNPTNAQLYNAFITCIDAIEALPEFKQLEEMLYG